MPGGTQWKGESSLMCFKCPLKHCFNQPVALGAKHFQAISWKACSLQQALTNHLCHSGDDGHCITNQLPNDRGRTPAPVDRTGCPSWVFIPLENSFQAIPLAPTKFSGQFSQSTDDSEASKQARPSRFSTPCSEKDQGQITKDLTDTREREEFQNSSDTDEDQRAFVPPHSNKVFSRPLMTREQTSNGDWFAFFNFLFHRALHWSV